MEKWLPLLVAMLTATLQGEINPTRTFYQSVVYLFSLFITESTGTDSSFMAHLSYSYSVLRLFQKNNAPVAMG
jgi:hypothetical protein